MPRPKSAPAPPAPVHPFDRLHGTETSGLLPAEWIVQSIREGRQQAQQQAQPQATPGPTPPRLTDLTAYYGIAPSILRGVIDLWLRDLQPAAPIGKTVFLDVGAGKGRAMLLAAEYPFLRVDGIELSPALSATAAANIATWQNSPHSEPLAPAFIHHADALRFALPAEPTLAFLFHPFEDAILRRFLRRVEDSLARTPRPFDLAYVNAEHDSLIDQHAAFRRLWTGRLAMSAEDHVADLAEIASQTMYGSTGDELCAIYRFIGVQEDGPKPKSSRMRNGGTPKAINAQSA